MAMTGTLFERTLASADIESTFADVQIVAAMLEFEAALAEAEQVPEEFLVAGCGALAWRDVDTDLALAELTFDSVHDAVLALVAVLTAIGGALKNLDRSVAAHLGEPAVEAEVLDQQLLSRFDRVHVEVAGPDDVAQRVGHGGRRR